MRQLLLSIGVFLAFLATARSGEQEAITTAEKAARSWLQLTDNQEYGRSWEQAAPLFRAAITKNDWEKSLVSARRPLGVLTSRKLKSAKFTRTLPGAPDGEYVVLHLRLDLRRKHLQSKQSPRCASPMARGMFPDIISARRPDYCPRPMTGARYIVRASEPCLCP